MYTESNADAEGAQGGHDYMYIEEGVHDYMYIER